MNRLPSGAASASASVSFSSAPRASSFSHVCTALSGTATQPNSAPAAPLPASMQGANLATPSWFASSTMRACCVASWCSRKALVRAYISLIHRLAKVSWPHAASVPSR